MDSLLEPILLFIVAASPVVWFALRLLGVI